MTPMLVGSASSVSLRSIKLFTFGCTLAFVLMIFQYEHKLRLFNSPRLMLTLPSLTLISICGVGSGKLKKDLYRLCSKFYFSQKALVGVIYPMIVTTIDRATVLEQNTNNIIRKSQVCKSVVIFLGINHLCVKIQFQSDLHFTLTLVFFCVAFWWWFDRSSINFIFSIIVSFLLTITTEILLRSGALQYTYSDFYLKTCVPCLTFAGAILIIQLTKLLSQPVQLSSTMDISNEQEHFKND
ncbi:unnamed protein product [Rotaria socialis]|uniref:Uncharacterized protein n=1 Tax=Rotaria socialis TaxID=392032 RepID=A0A821CK75_9BILA|nr:unnamed protein product [Rotaria socialis]CAF4509661.1 unnamed protein product [Rotaria socialis]CAF4611086.1 unnamed protein product [Rotaria socialis]